MNMNVFPMQEFGSKCSARMLYGAILSEDTVRGSSFLDFIKKKELASRRSQLVHK